MYVRVVVASDTVYGPDWATAFPMREAPATTADKAATRFEVAMAIGSFDGRECEVRKSCKTEKEGWRRRRGKSKHRPLLRVL